MKKIIAILIFTFVLFACMPEKSSDVSTEKPDKILTDSPSNSLTENQSSILFSLTERWSPAEKGKINTQTTILYYSGIVIKKGIVNDMRQISPEQVNEVITIFREGNINSTVGPPAPVYQDYSANLVVYIDDTEIYADKPGLFETTMNKVRKLIDEGKEVPKPTTPLQAVTQYALEHDYTEPMISEIPTPISILKAFSVIDRERDALWRIEDPPVPTPSPHIKYFVTYDLQVFDSLSKAISNIKFVPGSEAYAVDVSIWILKHFQETPYPQWSRGIIEIIGKKEGDKMVVYGKSVRQGIHGQVRGEFVFTFAKDKTELELDEDDDVPRPKPVIPPLH